MDRHILRLMVAGAVAALGLCSLFALRILAQSGNTPWTNAVNVSKSGAASRPMITVASDGTLHVMWWDTTEGEQYVHTTNVTDTTWTEPVAIPAILGSRKIDFETGREILTPPQMARLVATTEGGVHALWIDTKDQLFDVENAGTSGRAGSTQLAESALDFNAASDVSGTLHLAYVRPMNSSAAPAGVYYRFNTGTGWSAPRLVYASQYFRSAKPGDVYPSVTGDGAGHAIVTWSDPQTGQSTYAQTADGGNTWSAPQAITEISTSRSLQARVASAPNGAWLMIWRDVEAGGCGFLQRLSTDGGQTWGAPQKVLSDITRCSETWSFMQGGDGRLWIIGRSAAPGADATTNTATIAAWDGTAWSKPSDLTLNYYDPQTTRRIALNCIGGAVAGSTAGVAGCDPGGDIWVARSTVDLKDLISAVKPVWGPVEIVSNRTSAAAPDDLPVVATDKQGNLFALWSQATGASDQETALFGATQSNDRWSRSTLLLRSPGRSIGTGTALQPSMAIDAQDRIHVVWSSGLGGPVAYSWVFARDFNGSAAWAEPTSLPAAVSASSRPDIAVDSAGERLFVIYAKPFNEQRGIYLVRSLDGGSTWLTPTLVFDAAAAQWEGIDKPQIALDERANVLHATWLQSTLPGSTSTRAVYYARSTDQGETWSTPLKVAEGAVDWPQLSQVNASELYLSWAQAAAQAKGTSPLQYSVWGQYSSDGGERWSPPEAVTGFEQVSGRVGLHSDNAGHLYLAAVGSSPGGESTLSVGQWLGQTWNAPEIFGLGQPAARDNAAAIAIVPTMGRLSALLRLWTLGQNNQGGYMVAATGRGIEPIVITPLPTFTPMPTMTPRPTQTPQPTPTPRPHLSNNEQQPATRTSEGPSPLVLGGVLAAVIVIIVVTRRTIVARRR